MTDRPLAALASGLALLFFGLHEQGWVTYKPLMIWSAIVAGVVLIIQFLEETS